MQIQINMSEPFEFRAGDSVPKFGFTGDIVVAVDPSKTNMAMTVGTPDGVRLCILQFRAPGSRYDNSDYCQDFKYFLTKYLEGCNILVFGIEKAISKRGMNHHYSSMVLTEIRSNLIDVAYTLTGKRATEINNWSWKYAVLPDGYRSQSVKGSARFLKELYDIYGNDDVTDSVCIYRFIVQTMCGSYAIIPSQAESPLAPCQIRIFPKGSVKQKARKFPYNLDLSLFQNATYFANRTWELGVTEVNLNDLKLEDIYAYAEGFQLPFEFSGGIYLTTIEHMLKVQNVEVVVVRS